MVTDVRSWLPDDLADLIEDPVAAARRLADVEGRRLVGVHCPRVPSEVIWACGGHPVLLPATVAPGAFSDAVLQSFTCMRVRSQAEAMLAASGQGLDAVVVPVGACDSLQNLGVILEGGLEGVLVTHLSLPVATNASGALAFSEAALRRWAESFCGAVGAQIPSDETLDETLFLWGELRSRLGRLEALSGQRRVARSVFLAAARACWTADPQTMIPILDRLIVEAPDEVLGDDDLAMGLVSGPLDDLALVRFFEEQGVCFVMDDCCTGSPVASGTDSGTGTPWRRMAERLLSRQICPVQWGSAKARFENGSNVLAARGGRAVVFLTWKYCDPHAFDNAILVRTYQEAGLATLELDLDPVLSGWGQIETRCQAFVESLMDWED
ncbi:MAG: 2-hydroxyacyl-CoA dehydratase [Deltaproteobacteria bacterium]|nr:2-hydroxyacyl-CoA dehydratase [Deltaproteobacteria bacterium]